MRIEAVQFYFTGGSTQQSYTLPWDCWLVGVDFAFTQVGTAASDSAMAYVATTLDVLTSATGVNNKIICACRSFASQLSAAGYAVIGFNKYVAIPDPGFRFSRNSTVVVGVGVNGPTVLANTFLHFRVKQ